MRIVTPAVRRRALPAPTCRSVPLRTQTTNRPILVKHRLVPLHAGQSLPTDAELWKFTVLLTAVVTVGMWLVGWDVRWLGVLEFLGCVGSLLGIGLFYHYTARSESLARVGFGLALLLSMAFACQTSTYLFATTGAPFRDAELRAADAMLGFSWTTWVAWLRQHPSLHVLMQLIYPWHLPQMALAVVVLADRPGHVAALLRAFAFSFLVALLGLVAIPALGNIPEARSVPVRWALQLGTFEAFDIFETTGIISMPSFHAVLAVLASIAAWPFRRARWLVAAFNILMLVATVSEGGHYLVDVLAGVILAFVAAWFARMPGLSVRGASGARP